ncbi:MAG: lysylphosphatidylglycerol synthase domain-containing protein [Thermoleophilia bacterium]
MARAPTTSADARGAWCTTTVVVAVPVLPGGLGAVEVAVPLVFRAAGVPYSEAVLAVLAWRVLQFWLPTVAGLGCYGQMMLDARRRTRAMGESPA